MAFYIFDMDGVLLDSMSLWEHLGEDFLATHGVKARPGLREAMVTLSMPQSAEFFRREYGISGSIEEIVAQEDALAEEFYTRRAPLKEGVQAVLEKLRGENVRCVVLTATDRPLAEAALRRTGILGYFSKIYTCTELHSSKDMPEIFLKLLEKEKVTPENAVVVEDSLHAIRSAHAAGIPTLAVFDESGRDKWPECRAVATEAVGGWPEWLERH
ncbi:MAG: HAD family phosphatase [Lentisphaeria bacterium]|nr:HAD family phosphatase [Lentisphaeria bacterium]